MRKTEKAESTGRRTARGFIGTQLLVGMAAIVLVGTVGYTLVNVSRSNTVAQQKTMSGHLLTQAAYTLTTETADTDNDGVPEPPAGSVVNGDGWNVPAASGAPKVDAWSTPLRYCPRDNGSVNSSTGRLSGDNPAPQSSIVLAVISAGPDKTMNTTCAQAVAGTVQSDDAMRAMTLSQVRQGVGGTVYYGDPVPDVASLEALPDAAVRLGQVRVVGPAAGGTTYVNRSGHGGTIADGNWSVTGGNGGICILADFASIAAQTAPIAPGTMCYASDTGAIYVNETGTPGAGNWLMASQPPTSSAVTASGSDLQLVLGTNYTGTSARPVTGAGGTGTLTYSITPASVLSPLGLTFNTANGAITGQPNATLAATPITIKIVDSLGRWTSKTVNLSVINIVNPTVGSFSLPYARWTGFYARLTPPSSNSPGAWTFTSNNTSVAYIAGGSGNYMVYVSNGCDCSVTITATQEASPPYAAATRTATMIAARPPTVNPRYLTYLGSAGAQGDKYALVQWCSTSMIPCFTAAGAQSYCQDSSHGNNGRFMALSEWNSVSSTGASVLGWATNDRYWGSDSVGGSPVTLYPGDTMSLNQPLTSLHHLACTITTLP